ncbi:NrsF family protein, partial [Enterobacter cloacae complex sp.6730722]
AKAAFTLGLAGSGFAALLRLARPAGAAPGAALAGLLAVVVAMGAAAGLQWHLSPPAMRLPLLLGATWAVCPWLIMALSAPILCGVF